jgi:ABC-type spermidine/putrescine transport system permease subunit I
MGPAKNPKSQHRLFWAALAAPGIIWLLLLFIVPFYAILSIAGGQLDIFGNPVAVWNPLQWSSVNVTGAWHDVAGAAAFVGPIMLRTVRYVALASLISLLIAYPAAYFVARFAGRRKALFCFPGRRAPRCSAT